MFLYRFPPHSPQWGLNIGALAGALGGRKWRWATIQYT